MLVSIRECPLINSHTERLINCNSEIFLSNLLTCSDNNWRICSLSYEMYCFILAISKSKDLSIKIFVIFLSLAVYKRDNFIILSGTNNPISS